MSLISTSEFSEWYGNTQLDLDTLSATIDAGQEAIENFIGYPIEAVDYTEYLYSSYGLSQLDLKKKPINSVSSIIVNDSTLDLSSEKMILKDQFVILPNLSFNDSNYEIQISYNAGYASADIPNLIIITLYEITGLMVNNSKGHIGKKSRTAINGGSTEYLEITFDKYLKKLNRYKVI